MCETAREKSCGRLLAVEARPWQRARRLRAQSGSWVRTKMKSGGMVPDWP